MAKNIENERFLSLKTDELLLELAAAQGDYVNLKFEHATKGLENPMKLRTTRRDIARMHTELHSRKLKADKEAAQEEE